MCRACLSLVVACCLFVGRGLVFVGCCLLLFIGCCCVPRVDCCLLVGVAWYCLWCVYVLWVVRCVLIGGVGVFRC